MNGIKIMPSSSSRITIPNRGSFAARWQHRSHASRS